MLGYLARTVPVLARAAVARRRAFSDLGFRVSPAQIDLNLHMNQAVYAQVMELGRADWLLRSGAWSLLRAAGVNPVVADQRIVYRRELRALQRYRLDTRAVGVEGRLLHLVGTLIVGDRVHTTNDTHLILVGKDGVWSADRVAEVCGPLLAPPLPVVDWRVVPA